MRLPSPHGSTPPASSSAPSAPVGVVRAGGEFRLVALQEIAAGERIFLIEGEKTHRPTRHSVQIGENLHIDLRPGRSLEEELDRYFWRYMNHGCEPTAMVDGRDVVALRDLRPFEDITIDYNATEYDMAEPFACRCGSKRCHGTVRGFRHLTRAEQERLRPSLADHLLRHLDAPPPATEAFPVPA